MTFSSVKYSELAQNEPEEEEDAMFADPQPSGMEYGSPAGTFDSVFTYANYNDLDRMGYEAPRRYGNTLGNRYSHYTYTNLFNDEETEVKAMSSVELVLYLFSVVFVVLTMPLSLLFAVKFISSSERLVVMRLGRAQKTRGPGVAIIVPCIDTFHRVTTNVTAFNVPPLQVITTDRGLIELGATVFLKIRDPIAAVCGVQDRNHSIRMLANTMLYRYVSRKRVCEISNGQDRRILAATFKDELGSFTGRFGIEITGVEISEVKVIKEGENMGLAALSSVVKSDAGKKLWEVIGPTVEEFSKQCVETREETSENLTVLDEMPQKPDQECVDVDHLIDVANLVIDDHLSRLIGKVYQIHLSDLEPIFVDLRSTPGTAGKGISPRKPDVIFETSQSVFSKLIRKSISPMNAYMDGSLKITGSIQDALSLKYLVERMSEWI